MATFARFMSRSSSLAGTKSSDDNGILIQRPRTPYPETSCDEKTSSRSVTNSSTSSNQQKQNVRTAPSIVNSSQSLPSSPLDNIPSKLYARFPRFSMTTEPSQPDLSIEDVTSTRFSIDEEGIIAIPYVSRSNHSKENRPGKLHRTLRKAISHQTMLLKRARVGVRQIPIHLGLVSKSKDTIGHASTSTASEVSKHLPKPASNLTRVDH